MRHHDEPRRIRPEDTGPNVLEPEIDPDSGLRIAEEHPDPPHTATRFDAGTGQGTVSESHYGDKTLDHPVLDGSTMSPEAEASVPNPSRGESDPATMHNQPALHTTSTTRWLFSSAIAGVFVVVILLLLAPFSPVWCGVGVAVALVALLAVLAVRASRIRRPARLYIEAVLLMIIWLVPLIIIITVLVTAADDIRLFGG